MHTATLTSLPTFSKLMIRPVLPETVLIASICLADSAWTMAAVALGLARESNPIMAAALHEGLMAFSMVKVGSFLIPLAFAECFKDRNPSLIRGVLRFVVAAYVLTYVGASLLVHGLL